MAKEKYIVFDMKDDVKKHLKKDARFSLSKTIRDAGIDIYRCISANLDRTSTTVFGISPDDNSNKTIIDICFPEFNPEDPVSKSICQKKLFDTSALLKKKGIKVIRESLYQDPDEPEKLLGKILVDLVVPTSVEKVEKPVISNQK